MSGGEYLLFIQRFTYAPRNDPESSSIANVTVRSKPCAPVMRTRNPPLNRSAAIQAPYGALVCLPPATTAASMRSLRWPGSILMSKTVTGIRLNCSDSGCPVPIRHCERRAGAPPDRLYGPDRFRRLRIASDWHGALRLRKCHGCRRRNDFLSTRAGRECLKCFSSVSSGSWIESYGSSLASDTRSWATADFIGERPVTR